MKKAVTVFLLSHIAYPIINMIIKYTKKTSGYIALTLSIITLKIFIEALIVGRGAVPGISFLLYTMVFYTHYNLENIQIQSSIIFNKILKLTKLLKENSLEYPIVLNKIYLSKNQINQKITILITKAQNFQNKYFDNTIKHGRQFYQTSKSRRNQLMTNFNIYAKKYLKISKTEIESLKKKLDPWIIQFRTQLVKTATKIKQNIFEVYGTLHKKWNLFISSTFD